MLNNLMGLGAIVFVVSMLAVATQPSPAVLAWDAAQHAERHGHVTVLPTIHIVGNVGNAPATLASR